MVDITSKSVSERVAIAQTQVQLPSEMRSYIAGVEINLKKGPVFQTAIIAGTMAVKRTHEMIPFCHQIPIESCKIKIEMNEDLLVTIHCQVKTTYKTGVEMEALHGANIAALTIYDMCKAVSHKILIKETKLLQKSGGKRNVTGRPTYGLVLTGGKSSRMNEDKALISYKGRPHAEYMYEILSSYCESVFISSRKDQWQGTSLHSYPAIYDDGNGPLQAMKEAFEKYPDVNWFVVACDLVHFNHTTVETLLSHLDEEKLATAYRNVEGNFPEALCAIYTPQILDVFRSAHDQDIRCPVKAIKNQNIVLVEPVSEINLMNVNTPQDRARVI